MTDLGTLGGASRAAVDINARGQVVGNSDVSSGGQRLGINARGQIVGSSNTGLGTDHTYVSEKGVMTDFGSLAEGA